MKIKDMKINRNGSVTADTSGPSEATEWREARFRARLLTPAFIAIVSPLVLAAILMVLLGPDFQQILGFADFVRISFYFVPAIVGVTIWQARILTTGPPLKEQALTGISAVMGIILNLIALGITLGVAAVAALVFVVNNFGLTPEVIMDWLLRIGLVVIVVFMMLSPYFMIVGTVLGMIVAAVVHHSYRPGWLTQVPRPAFTAATLLFVSLCILLYLRWFGVGLLPG